MIQVVNLSEFEPSWHWLRHAFVGTDTAWHHLSSQDLPPAGRRLPFETARRIGAAWRSRKPLSSERSVLVSHGPRMTMYGALLDPRPTRGQSHLAFSFNFTELPSGKRRRLMARAFRSVERFVVASTMERDLYAECFDIDPRKIDMLHWSVRAPQPSAVPLGMPSGRYICALGSQARDYATLVEAMKSLPDVKLVIVGTPASLAGLQALSNVEIRTQIPLQQATDLLAGSDFLVLPLAGSEVPCGHVTLVSAMHLGKAIVSTGSAGIADYIVEGVNGRIVPAFDAAALTRAIATLWDSPAESAKLGEAGKAFASENCSESSAMRYFSKFLQTYAPPSRRG